MQRLVWQDLVKKFIWLASAVILAALDAGITRFLMLKHLANKENLLPESKKKFMR